MAKFCGNLFSTLKLRIIEFQLRSVTDINSIKQKAPFLWYNMAKEAIICIFIDSKSENVGLSFELLTELL